MYTYKIHRKNYTNQLQLKAKEKRCVFSLDLKTSMDWADRMERCRWLQREGAAAAKERSPLVHGQTLIRECTFCSHRQAKMNHFLENRILKIYEYFLNDGDRCEGQEVSLPNFYVLGSMSVLIAAAASHLPDTFKAVCI